MLLVAEDWLVSSPPMTVSCRRRIGAWRPTLSCGGTVGSVVPALRTGRSRRPRPPNRDLRRIQARVQGETRSSRILDIPERSDYSRRVQLVHPVRQGSHGLSLHGDQVGPDVGWHPLQKYGSEQKPRAEVNVDGKVGEHLVHELGGFAVPQLRELQQ